MLPSKAFIVLSLGFLGGVVIAHFIFSWTVWGAFILLSVILLAVSSGAKSRYVKIVTFVFVGLVFGYLRVFLPSPSVPEGTFLFTEAQDFFVERVERVAGGTPQVLFTAMVLGPADNLSDHAKDVLNITAPRHIVSISGLHMAIVAVIVLKLLIAAGLWRKQAVPVALLIVALYILLVGAPPAAIRAGFMAGLFFFCGMGVGARKYFICPQKRCAKYYGPPPHCFHLGSTYGNCGCHCT